MNRLVGRKLFTRHLFTETLMIQAVAGGMSLLFVGGIIWKTEKNRDKILKDTDNIFKKWKLEDKKEIKKQNFWYKSTQLSELNKTLRHLVFTEQFSDEYRDSRNKMSVPYHANVVCDNMAYIQSTLEEYSEKIESLRQLGKECSLEKNVDAFLLTESYKSKIESLFKDNCEYCEKLGEYNFVLKAIQELIEKCSK